MLWEKITAAIGGGLLTGVSELIKDFKLPPEQAAALEQKLAETEATVRTTIERIAADDRANARAREIARQDWTPSLLGWTVLVIFGAANFHVFTHTLPSGNEMLIARVLGTMDMAVGLVLGYYYGTSAGSSRKNDIIHSLQKDTPR